MAHIDSIKTKISLNITIVGAGIGGLAAAIACAKASMKVNVYEATRELTEVGAGIQIGPNMSRILRRWGILDHLLSEAVPLKTISVRRYADNSELAHISMADVEETYEGPILVTHRADLQRVLKVAAEDAGVHIETGAFVEDIDFANARIKIKDRQEWLKSDLIIAADGLKSTIRKKMLALHGQIDQARETGDAAWRVIIPSEKIYGTGDMSLIEALEKPAGFRWIGPDAHIMGYPIRNHQLFNLVLLHPDNVRTQESWTVKGDKKEMLQFYRNWNSLVRRLLDLVPNGEVLEWKLCDHASLATWIEGKVALIGDAAHPMLPYVAQGAAQAVEDGAVLSACLSMIDSKEEINVALKVYELVRKERAEIIHMTAAKTREVLHLPDGEKQRKRDHLLMNAGKGDTSPDFWTDKSFQQWCWGTDQQKQTIEMWDYLLELVTSDQAYRSPFSTEWLESLKRILEDNSC